jgi:hypothetical protein
VLLCGGVTQAGGGPSLTDAAVSSGGWYVGCVPTGTHTFETTLDENQETAIPTPAPNITERLDQRFTLAGLTGGSSTRLDLAASATGWQAKQFT